MTRERSTALAAAKIPQAMRFLILDHRGESVCGEPIPAGHAAFAGLAELPPAALPLHGGAGVRFRGLTGAFRIVRTK